MLRSLTMMIALALVGCAGNVRWVKGNATTAEFEQDKLVCQYEATKATASGGNFGMRTAIGAGIEEGLRQNEITTMCLRTKGWSLQTVAVQAAPVYVDPQLPYRDPATVKYDKDGVPEPLPMTTGQSASKR